MRQMPPRRNCGAAFFLWRTPGAQRSARPLSGNAAPRRAGQQAPPTAAGSRPGTPVPRPTVPGKVQEGAGAPSWFPPPLAVERSRIIFRHGVYVTKNPSHGATCETGPAPRGWTRFAPKRSTLSFAPGGIAAGSEETLTEKGRPTGGLFRELIFSPSAPSSAARG